MNTYEKKPMPGKPIVLLAAFGLATMAMAVPAMAHGNRNGGGSMYNNGHYDNRYMRSPRQHYTGLNRINQYGVRGKIIRWGRGPLQGCFRVKRTGRFQGDSAIVTVRYCLDGYGKARFDRGSKRLVRYLNDYRPTHGYGYRQPMRRY